MEYAVKYGQTIFDIALKTYGSAEYVYKIIQENTFITGIDYDFDANPGALITWDETFVVSKPTELNTNATVNEVTTAYVTATNGQSIYDLCLMTYGDLKHLYRLMSENNIVGPNDTDLNGKKITFNPELIEDVAFYNHLKTNKKVINTIGDTSTASGKAYNSSFNISFH
jgi:hypothetical protein